MPTRSQRLTLHISRLKFLWSQTVHDFQFLQSSGPLAMLLMRTGKTKMKRRIIWRAFQFLCHLRHDIMVSTMPHDERNTGPIHNKQCQIKRESKS